jgi:branched-chain amino acid aminotransferase
LLETGSGNLFVVEGNGLITPQADGRIRPGATREAAIALAREIGIEVRAEEISIRRARAADGVFRTSAIRGLESVARCEGVGEWNTAPIAQLLAERLRDRWRLQAG